MEAVLGASSSCLRPVQTIGAWFSRTTPTSTCAPCTLHAYCGETRGLVRRVPAGIWAEVKKPIACRISVRVEPHLVFYPVYYQIPWPTSYSYLLPFPSSFSHTLFPILLSPSSSFPLLSPPPLSFFPSSSFPPTLSSFFPPPFPSSCFPTPVFLSLPPPSLLLHPSSC